MKENVIIQVNSNFHHLAGQNLYEKKDSRFKEYRDKWEEWPKHFYIGDFPLFVDIEVTSLCNLSCPFCATTFRTEKIKKGFIAFDIVKKIIDEGSGKGLCGIKLNIRGEPLLHPLLPEFIRYAKKNGLIDVYFNTNAMLLTEDISKKLIEASLDRITISVEGFTKEFYERYRVGAKFETILSNIKKMQLLKNKINADHPKIRVQTVMLPEMEHIFDKYKNFWSDFVEEVAFLDYKEMKDRKKGLKYPWACPQLWQRMAVWWDGTILPCNHDDDGLLAIGNIKNMTLEDAWNSKGLDRLREKHKKGLAHEITACDGCYLRDSEINKLKRSC